MTFQSNLDYPNHDLENLLDCPSVREPASSMLYVRHFRVTLTARIVISITLLDLLSISYHISNLRISSPNRDLENLSNGAGDTFDIHSNLDGPNRDLETFPMVQVPGPPSFCFLYDILHFRATLTARIVILKTLPMIRLPGNH